MYYTKPKVLYYGAARLICSLVAKILFRTKVLRNEIRDAKGPYVVIANHQSALDFVGLIGLTKRPMSFVISHSFFYTLPVSGYLAKMGVIPKLQFQTGVGDMRRMKAVIDKGEPLVIYPAGLMCEDGLSTPIPQATYKFLKWLKADIYVARCSGTYFVMPKWAGNLRPGRTHMDVYRLFSKEELAQTDLQEIRRRVDEALLYDAYREQEQLQVPYQNNRDLRGLEHVLYRCPHCGGEFTMENRQGHTLACTACGYEQTADELGFFHNEKGLGPELRYVSDWSRMTYEACAEQVHRGELTELSCPAEIRMIDRKKHKFVPVGRGELCLTAEKFTLRGEINGRSAEIASPVAALPTLPFKPGRYLELQQGEHTYRCVLTDGRLTMKFIHLLKIFHQLSQKTGETQTV